MQRFAQDFERAVAGNLVIIKHQLDDRVEYSSYGHLKTGSVTVKVGQSVRQGEKIAEVGNTGDSTLTHLHFQINRRRDAVLLTERSSVFFRTQSLVMWVRSRACFSLHGRNGATLEFHCQINITAPHEPCGASIFARPPQ